MRQTTSAMLSLILLLPALLWVAPDQTSPVPMRFMEGAVHGFVVLSSTNNDVIASGDISKSACREESRAARFFTLRMGLYPKRP